MSRSRRSSGDRVTPRPRPTTGPGRRLALGVASAVLALSTACGNNGGSAPGPSGSAPVAETGTSGPGASSAVGAVPTTSAAGSTGNRVGTAAPTGPAAPATVDALSATGWKLTGLVSGGTTTPVDPTLNGWVRFALAAHGLQVAFNTTCNRGGGSATVTADGTGGELTFGPQRVTLIYCDGPGGSTETVMLALFAGPRAFTVEPTAGTLTIVSTDGASGMTFAADPSVGADAFDAASGSASATTTG